jgi:hypothetical protein
MNHGATLAPGLALATFLAIAEPAGAQLTSAKQANVQAYASDFFDQFHPTTAMTMVNNVPGFTFDGGSGVRGYAGAAGNVLIDGQRPPEDLSNVLNRMPADAVERIDIIRGGADGIDMHGKPVVVNVIRKRQARTSGATNGTLTLNDRGDPTTTAGVQVRRQKGDRNVEGSLTLSSFRLFNQGETVRLDPQGAVLKDSLNQAVNLDHRYEATGAIETPMGHGQLRANVRLSTENFRVNGLNTLLIPGGAEINKVDNSYSLGELGLRYIRTLANGMAWEAVALEQINTNPQNGIYDTTAFTSGSNLGIHGGQSVLSTTLTLPAHGPWAIEAGTEAAYNFRNTDSAYSFNGQPFALAGDQTQVHEIRTETFVTGTWRPRPSITAETSLRLEQSQISADGSAGAAHQALSYIKPRTIITWSPTSTDQLGLRVERTVNQLSFGSFASQASFSTGVFGIGNPEIRPQTIWLAELRYEKRFAQRGSVLVILSRSRGDDLTGSVSIFVPDPGGGPPHIYDVSRNDGPAFTNSLVIATSLPLERFGLKGWTLTSRNNWTLSQISDPVTGIIRRLSGEQPVTWNVGLARSRPDSKLSWNVNLSGPGFDRNYAPRSISTYHYDYAVGAGLSYQMPHALTLTAGLNNLNAGSGSSTYTQYSLPRSIGAPAYFESSPNKGYRSAYVGFRQGF